MVLYHPGNDAALPGQLSAFLFRQIISCLYPQPELQVDFPPAEWKYQVAGIACAPAAPILKSETDVGSYAGDRRTREKSLCTTANPPLYLWVELYYVPAKPVPSLL